MPVAMVASAQMASWPSMGGYAVPSGSTTWSAPSGQPKPKSSIKPPTVPTSHIPQCVACSTSNAPLAITLAWDLLPMDGYTPCFECTLELPNSLVVHMVCHQGQGLKQALDISSAHLAAFMVSSAGGDHWFVSIQSSDQQIGEALVVIGKQIAKKQVHIPQKQCSGNIAPAVAALAPLGSTVLSSPTSTRLGVPSSSTLAVASNTTTMAPTPSTQQPPSLLLGSQMLSIHEGATLPSPMDTTSPTTLSTPVPEVSALIIQYTFGHYSMEAEPAIAHCSQPYWGQHLNATAVCWVDKP
ncbi:hypothetical protein C0989_008617 [Termitomyces sp. Mn162]|nr:hypothetical protein C0989_008617 [Termitomyces sp. Mn162]